MKVFQLEGDGYREAKDCGTLQPFSEVSLVAQIVKAADGFRGEGTTRIVFSKDEEAEIAALSNLVNGGLERNQGLGHISGGVPLFLEQQLRPAGLIVTYHPATSSEKEMPTTDVREWLLAIQIL